MPTSNLTNKENGTETLPSWNSVKSNVLPYIEAADSSQGFTPALRSTDTLATMLTNKIKMNIVYLYNGLITPLTEHMIHQWKITWGIIRLALEDNMNRLMQLATLQSHTSPFGMKYMDICHPAPTCNVLLAFYKPFQQKIHQELGETYYMSVPERTTSIIFGASQLEKYIPRFRNDILLTYDSSAKPLSTELIEVSSADVIALLD